MLGSHAARDENKNEVYQISKDIVFQLDQSKRISLARFNSIP